jgi:peptidylprolyl isomerase
MIHSVTIRSLLRGLPPIAAALALGLTPVAARSATADGPVARIGDTDVSGDELRAYVETLGAQEQAAIAKDPSLLAQVVRSYLARQAVLKEARAKKWDQDPARKAQLDRVRDEALTELYLQTVSQPPASYPSDAEVQAAYDANRGALQVPRRFRVAQVFLAAAKGDKDAEEKARKRADDVAKKLERKGADFAAIASAESDDKATAQRRGEIGWLTEEQMVPGIRATVTGLTEGAVSAPVRLDDGWHVMKVLETKPASTRPLAEVRDAIAAQLRAERARANRQAYLASLLDKNPPAINELALSKLLAKPAR